MCSLAPFPTYTRIPASPRSAHPTRATVSIDRFFHRRISIGYYPLTNVVSGYGGARCVFSSKHAPLWWLAFASSVLHGSGPRNWGTFLLVPCDLAWWLGKINWEIGALLDSSAVVSFKFKCLHVVDALKRYLDIWTSCTVTGGLD